MASSSSIAAASETRSRVGGTAISGAFLGFEPYVAAEEAAAFLKITPRRVKEMARAGTIPAHPVECREKGMALSPVGAFGLDA
jgi:hypothetical protein